MCFLFLQLEFPKIEALFPKTNLLKDTSIKYFIKLQICLLAEHFGLLVSGKKKKEKKKESVKKELISSLRVDNPD